MADHSSLIELLLKKFAERKVEVVFKEGVLTQDLPGYDKGMVKHIFKAILKRFEGNANPHHTSEAWQLTGDLFPSFKIRMMDVSIRIVYRFEELEDCTKVVIYAIGPREDSEVYNEARKRKDW